MREEVPTRWCHLHLTAQARPRVFKVAANARFCERLIHGICDRYDWRLDSLVVRMDQLQLLVEVPRRLGKDEVAVEIIRLTNRAFQRGKLIKPLRSAWTHPFWCATLDPDCDGAVRKHIVALGGRTTRPMRLLDNQLISNRATAWQP